MDPRTVTLQSVEAALEIYLERGQADLHVAAAHNGAQGHSALSVSGTFKRLNSKRWPLTKANGSCFLCTRRPD